MAASGKRLVVGDGDRLSALPDCLLHTILSMLPAWKAVQTCVLSRRWEGLWCSMPCLNIDEKEFPASAPVPGTWGGPCVDIEKRHARFEEFVSNLLMFHSVPSLDRFRIDVDDDREFKFLDRWIRRGIKGCPAVVEICLWSHYYRLPRLSSGSSRFKKLQLVRTTVDSIFTGQLTSNFPVLEDLLMENCYLVDTEITSRTLKNLIVRECYTELYSDELTITAPALAYLELVIGDAACNWLGVELNELSPHLKATISIHTFRPIKHIFANWHNSLLCSLINVRCLTLSGSQTLGALHKEILDNKFPVFHNLTTLLFNKCVLSDNFQILGFFLKKAPRLEKLTLQRCQLREGFVESKTGDSTNTTPLKYQDTVTFKCPDFKCNEIKYQEDDDLKKLFDILLGVWRNLQKTTI